MFGLWRWWRSARALMDGARVHPSAVVLGKPDQIHLAKGASVGARSRLDPGSKGRIGLGEGVWLSSDVEIETATRVRIGPTTTVQRRCTLNGSTTIGAGCIFAPDVFVSSGTHPFRHVPHLPIREQERLLSLSAGGADALDRPVWIQDDCWLGTHVVVCPGVTIGKGSVIGANSVVTHDVAPYTVVAGAPARMIGRRLTWEPGIRLSADRPQDLPYVLSGLHRQAKADEQLPDRIEATPDMHFQAVLSAPEAGGELACFYIAPARVNVDVGGESLALEAGRGRFGVPLGPLKSGTSTVDCIVRVRNNGPHAVLWIVAVEVVSSP